MERTIVSSPAANAEDDIDEVQEYLNQSANTAAAQNDDSDDSLASGQTDSEPTPESAPGPEQLEAGFTIGFAVDRNKRYRRSMEDAHSFYYNFGDIKGAGFFGIFDGHAGKSTAEWCGSNLHENFQEILLESPDIPVSDVLNKTFLKTDQQLGEKKGLFSGATAIVAYVRNEPITNPTDSSSPDQQKRVLYAANAGDSRAVLCRNGAAVRLSYDHKGSDQIEVQRIVEAGGFVMNNRVNGVLAVTRSLGDIAMKEWVIGSPYTTETILDDKDSCLILACDGLWDVCTDQAAVDLIKNESDPQVAAETLLEYALNNMSTDNLSILVIKFH